MNCMEIFRIRMNFPHLNIMFLNNLGLVETLLSIKDLYWKYIYPINDFNHSPTCELQELILNLY